MDRRPDATRHRRYEAPLVAALMAAWLPAKAPRSRGLNADFLASRESAELRAETAQMGFSMRRLLRDLRDDNLASVAPRRSAAGGRLSHRRVRHRRLLADRPDAALCAYLWSWAENQVMAALKPCRSARPPASACWRGWAPDSALRRRGSGPKRLVNFTPAFAIACARHETQYSRLFRS
jgi:urease accessory protein